MQLFSRKRTPFDQLLLTGLVGKPAFNKHMQPTGCSPDQYIQLVLKSSCQNAKKKQRGGFPHPPQMCGLGNRLFFLLYNAPVPRLYCK